MAFIDRDNILREGYSLTGFFASVGLTILMFEDPFLFLGEDDSNLMGAERNEAEIYKVKDIESGILNGE